MIGLLGDTCVDSSGTWPYLQPFGFNNMKLGLFVVLIMEELVVSSGSPNEYYSLPKLLLDLLEPTTVL